jgi:hypothetical protein
MSREQLQWEKKKEENMQRRKCKSEGKGRISSSMSRREKKGTRIKRMRKLIECVEGHSRPLGRKCRLG